MAALAVAHTADRTTARRAAARVVARLSVPIDGDAPPREVRLFVAGWNDTEHGRFLFDADAAASVLASYQKHGVDRMIDLEHLSLEDPERSVNYDPDARGWAKLELRDDGSLWAVDVTWTPDGETRLREKRQRYVSPAFLFDEKTKRVTQVVNIAITALPATHSAPELVAATARAPRAAIHPASAALLAALGGTAMLDPKVVAEALDAVTAGDAEKCIEILKGLIASAASGGEDPPVEEPPAEEPPADEPSGEMAAAASVLRTITGKASVTEALSEVQRLRAIATDVEAKEAKLAADRAAIERAERRELVAQLVRSRAAAPFIAWAKDADGLPDGKTPSFAFAAIPLEELRAHVASLGGGKGAAAPAPTPPGATGGGLSERELAMCRAKKVDPAAYAATKAAIAARSGRPRVET